MAKDRYPDKTHADVAMHFGVQLQTAQEWGQRGMPKKGKDKRYNLRDIALWLRKEGPWKQNAKLDDDDVFGGSDSPNLERYRAAKAQLAEFELGEKKKELFNGVQINDLLLRCASRIRKVGERLGKRYGADAQNAINDAMDDFAFDVANELGKPAAPSSQD